MTHPEFKCPDCRNPLKYSMESGKVVCRGCNEVFLVSDLREKYRGGNYGSRNRK